jgi:hypothetical protein
MNKMEWNRGVIKSSKRTNGRRKEWGRARNNHPSFPSTSFGCFPTPIYDGKECCVEDA